MAYATTSVRGSKGIPQLLLFDHTSTSAEINGANKRRGPSGYALTLKKAYLVLYRTNL